MNTKILNLLSRNARYTEEELAVMTGLSKEEVEKEIAEMEEQGLICGYKALIDWEKVDSTLVSAIIDQDISSRLMFKC